MGWSDEDARKTLDQWCEAIKAVRNLRAERNVPNAAKVAPIILAAEPVASILRSGEAFIRSLANASTVMIAERAERPAECAVAVLGDAEILLPLEGLIDRKAEEARHRKALVDLDKQIGPARAKLDNENFVSRAKPEVVAQLRTKLAELEAQREAVLKLLGESS
jgi:valyl-tRNA synthetase